MNRIKLENRIKTYERNIEKERTRTNHKGSTLLSRLEREKAIYEKQLAELDKIERKQENDLN